jgi:hypothetical protein
VEEAGGSHYTICKTCEVGMKIFECAYRDPKVKIFVSSCCTTTLEDYKSVLEPSGETVTLHRPQVVAECRTHKSKSKNYQMKNKGFFITFPLGSVDTANYRRDNLISYHDLISIERWKMRFSGLILGICEANAFCC